MISKESATAKAEEVKTELKHYELMKKALLLAIDEVKKFDNKVYNARFTNALNKSVESVEGRFTFGAVSNYAFGIKSWLGKYRCDHMVYSFTNLINTGLSEIRIYNRATDLMDTIVELFTIDGKNLRIKSEGWIALFHSRIDMYEIRIKEMLPFESAEFIYESYLIKEKLEEEKRKIQDKIYEVVPPCIR